ncbi:ATP-binding protein [Pseudomonas asplenii]|uniref:ATP-binding protein n=1 Tax=Pseudomonas asplenii TaxID=53407 RepID=UPI0022342C73|nr:ATP-binding protein [Pseudomonas asplenii]UZE26657.1 ATP-binding protein [Pseudomonas asplenii]
MKLIHIFIEFHKSIRSLNISLGGPFSLCVTEESVTTVERVDTTAYYCDYHCSAIIGANGVGKSSILDFLETSLHMSDSSGILIFFDESDRSLHACCINMKLPNSRDADIIAHDDFESFAQKNSIKIIKINNVTEAQNRLGYEKQLRHPLVQNRSLDNYSRLKSRRKRYFDNLLRYFRRTSGSDNIIEDVGFEFNFHDASEKFLRSPIATNFPEKHKNLYHEAHRTLNRFKASHRKTVQSSQDLIEILFALNIYPLIMDISSEVNSESRKKVSDFLYFYLLKSISYGYSTLLKAFEDSIEALKYAENWDVFRLPDLDSSLFSDDIDIYRMQEVLNQAKHVFTSISYHIYEVPRRSRDSGSELSFLIDDFFSVSEIIGLLNSLSRNVLSNTSWGWRGISTGEMARAHIFSETFDCLKNAKRGSYLIIIDEVDLYLHPEWQRSFLHSYLELLLNIKNPKARPQVILTTHSPIIVSDFLPNDIASLSKDVNGRISTRKSLGFGTNITNLFIDGMHVDSTFGEHSRRAIISLMERAKENSLSSFDKALVKEMGDTYIREYLLRND